MVLVIKGSMECNFLLFVSLNVYIDTKKKTTTTTFLIFLVVSPETIYTGI